MHDLRHTVGMRLREAGAREETISDILWHSRGKMTAHYSVAQVHELLDVLNLISGDSNRTNASLEMLYREMRSPFKVLSKEKRSRPFLIYPIVFLAGTIGLEPTPPWMSADFLVVTDCFYQ